MRTEDMILVSVDDHVVEPPTLFDNHLPDKWKDAAPKSVHKDGIDVWEFEGNVIPNIGLNAVAGRPPEEYNIEPTSFDMIRAGCYDIHERVKDMNRNGVLGSMCFPSFVQFCGQLFSKSKDLDTSIHLLRAYNDWHIDEWCGTYPGRFMPLSIPPIWDPQLMADEVRRVAKKGCHAVTFSENPYKLGWPHIFGDHWDPFFAACEDEGTVICLHIGSSSTQIEIAPGAPIDVMITLTPLNTMQAATDLVWSPVLRKFPNLQFALSEGGTGWIPYWLERLDYVYHQHRFWTMQDFGDTPAVAGGARPLLVLLHLGSRRRRAGRGHRLRQRHVGVRLSPLRLELAQLPGVGHQAARGHGRLDRQQVHARERHAHLPVRPVRAHPARPGHGRGPPRPGHRLTLRSPPTSVTSTTARVVELTQVDWSDPTRPDECARRVPSRSGPGSRRVAV